MQTIEAMLKMLMDVSNPTSAIGKIQKQLNNLKLPNDLNESFKDSFKELENSVSEVQNRLKAGFKTKSDVSGLEKSFKRVDKAVSDIITNYNKIDSDVLKKSIDISGLEKFKTISQTIQNYTKELDNIKGSKAFDNIIKQAERLGQLTKANALRDFFDNLKAGNVEGMSKALSILEKRTVDLEEEGKKLYFGDEDKQNKYNIRVQNLKRLLDDLVNNTNINSVTNGLARAKVELDNLEAENINELRMALEAAGTDLNELQRDFRSVGQTAVASADNTRRMTSEMNHLTSQVQAFFGISNTIELFKRGIRQAFESVRELDKAMTETAVVTDFSVSDMWNALPRYTAAANELGTTTLGAYETMTLYYQQGLKTNEVFEIGTETMKMARIASMDYTKATDLMTAALRGFNMELNQTSAQRINDVYSELAAITAADTEEIADSMTRTASIASSAGMEFETTSAFLSQMIETTREAPENLGTAMKTIIARFQELKKAPSEIASEIDGEAVNVNKIDAALKSIGVSLMDNVTGQFRKLDDVFLEISEKWDGLDKNTQRYIATVAAGSRQQSRFIAMMSNYDRTMELVDAANNSAGASQRQFEKTTESLESKLNKLKNAWNEFTRNLANSTVIKGAVDILTTLINIINKILNTMPGAISMFTAFGISIKGLGIGRKVIQALISTLAELIATTDASVGATLFKNLSKQFNSTGEKASILGAIIDRLKNKLGRQGMTAAATDAIAVMQSAQVAGVGAGAGMEAAGAGAATAGAGFAATLGPILAVVAAIGAVVAIGYALWNSTQETEKELKRVSEAANDAADHTNTLKDSISKLSEKQEEMIAIDSSFDNLIEGTSEWNSKLIESNSLISEIISQFPEMAQYLQTIDGRMQFDEAGWDEVNKRFEERLQTASNLQASLTAKQNTLSAKAAIENTNLKTGYDGITEEDKIKVAEFFAKNPTETNAGVESLRTQLLELGLNNYSDATLQSLLDSADELASAFHNYTVASDSENAVIKSLLEGNLNTAGITGSAATAAANIASKSYKPEEIDSILWFNNAANEEQTRQWAEQMGYRLDSYSGWGQGVKYTDLATGEKGEISNEEVLVQFNELEAQEKATKVAEEVANSLTIDNKAFSESFKEAVINADLEDNLKKSVEDANLSEAFSGLLSGDTLVDKDLINAIVGDPKQLSSVIDNMLDGLSDDEKAERIANYLGKDIEEVKKDIPKYTNELISTLKNNAKKTQEIQKRQDNKLRGMIGKAAGFTSEDVKFYQEHPNAEKGTLSFVEDYINALSEEQKQFLVEIGDKLTTNLGENSLKPFLANMKEIYSTGNEEQIKKVTDYISGIDFSNPIQATKELKLGVNSDIEALSSMSEGLLETGKSSLDAAAQFQYLYQQESFSDITEEIDKMVLEEGKIDGAGVIELTSKSSDLKDMIDNTGISVETLGQTFTALSKGDIALTDLNSGVMNALASFDQLNGIIRETSDFVGNLDLGVDTGKLSEDLHSTAEEIVEMYEGGEYGNPQIENFIKQFFGEDRWNEALTKAKGNLQVAASQFIDDIKLIDDNLYSVWASFDEKDQARLDKYNKEAGTDIQISRLEDGAMELDIGKASTEEVIQGIMEAYQVTEEYANLILTDFMNNSADLRTELANNDWTAGIQEYLKNNKLTTYEDGKETEQSYINAKDITTLSKVTGKDEVEYWKALADELGIVTDDLKTVDELKTKISETHTIIDIDVNNLEEVRSFFSKKYKINFDSETAAQDLAQFADGAVLDLDKVQKTLESMHVPQDVIDKIKTEMASIWGEENKDNKVKLEGVELSATEVAEDIQAATEKAAKQADFTAMGEAIAKALSGIEVDYDHSSFTKSNSTVTKDLKDKTDSAISKGAHSGIGKAKSEWTNWTLSDKSASVNITPNLTKTKITLTTDKSGKSVTLTAAKEGIGRNGLPKKEKALVGEVGPELVENQDGTATLYGVNGPTIANLNKGAIVHNAEDTKKILKGNDNFKTINRYELDGKSTGYKKKSQQKGSSGTGGNNSKNNSGNNGGTKDKSSKKDKKEREAIKVIDYSDPLDKLYNVLKRIEKEQRMINKYQERYERLLTKQNVTGQDLIKNLQKQEKYYRLLADRSIKTKKTRQEQIADTLNSKVEYKHTYTKTTKNKKTGKLIHKEGDEAYLKSKNKLSKYLSYDKDYNLVTVKNFKALEKLRKSKNVKDRELYDEIIEQLNVLNGWQGDIEDANDNIEDAKNALEDIKELGHDAFRELEDRVYQALVQREQDKIDKLSQIDDSINNANQDMINTIQDNLSKIRQDRQNQETEDDITAKERRLAYLRRDTSNANALEIKQLEEELANQKQDYTDTLIDQKISELQEQNEIASEQRQQQIDLLQAQLDYDEENGAFWSEAHDMIEEGIDNVTGALKENSDLVRLLQSAEGWEGLSKQGKMDWMGELNSQVAQAVAYLKNNNNAETVLNDDSVTLEELWANGQIKTGDKVTLHKAGGGKETIEGKVNDKGEFVYTGIKGDNVYFNYGGQMVRNEDGTFTSQMTADEARKFEETKKKTKQTIYKLKNGKIVKDVANRNIDGTLTWPSGNSVGIVYQGEDRKYYTAKAKEYIDKNHPKGYKNFKWRYKQGGLADFTGPAWLDGTKSKPEMVLNARDTENFIQLKDILKNLLNQQGNYNNSEGGDNYYEIKINVERLENDYDVDKVAEKVKKIINSDARYRNVNAINRLR